MIRRMSLGCLILSSLCLAGAAAGIAQETTEARSPDVVYVGTPHDIVAKMLEIAQVKKEDILYDPGCGDGRICVAAASKYGCKAIGFDLNPVRIKESLENVKRHGVESLVRIERKDIFTVDFTEATVVTSYLLPWMNKKLVPQVEKMKAGTRIVAHDYSFGGFKPDKEITVKSKQDGVEHYIYLYTLPLTPDPNAVDDEDSEEE